MTDWQAELLRELQQLETSPNGDGLTTKEIARAKGWTESVTDTRLRQMFDAGKIECCRKFVTNRAGARQPVPAYRKKEN